MDKRSVETEKEGQQKLWEFERSKITRPQD